ncbi:MAG: hypothetical protein ABR576_08535 [Thermoanaerobaculia bacterium]
MGKINWGRVILGGIVAGIVINLSEWILNEFVMKEKWVAAMSALGKTGAMTTNQIIVWNIWGFLAGIGAVWLYAAIRPRYGPGAGTAVKAGIAVWFFAHLLAAIVMMNLGLFPRDLMMIPLVWTLVETILATVAGAWVYKEV